MIAVDVQALNIPSSPAALQPRAVMDSSSLRILRLLQASPSRTQRQLADELGMSLGKTNYVLRALLGKGMVRAKRLRNSSPNRGYTYLVTPKGLAAKTKFTRRFLSQKIEEYEALRLEIEQLRAESADAV